MRQQRNEEAKQLIGNTVDKAKAIFNQNTANAQLANKVAKTAPVKPVRNSITRSANSQRQQSPDQENSQQPPKQSVSPIHAQSTNTDLHISHDSQQDNKIADQPANSLEDNENNSYSTIKRSPYSKSNSQNEPSANDKQTGDDKQTDEPVQQTAIEQSTTEQQPAIDAVNPGGCKVKIVNLIQICIIYFNGKYTYS